MVQLFILATFPIVGGFVQFDNFIFLCSLYLMTTYLNVRKTEIIDCIHTKDESVHHDRIRWFLGRLLFSISPQIRNLS